MLNYLLVLLGVVRMSKIFTYKYQRYPFDSYQKFEVECDKAENADDKAKQIMTAYFENGWTIMTNFIRVGERIVYI